MVLLLIILLAEGKVSTGLKAALGLKGIQKTSTVVSQKNLQIKIKCN